MILPPKNDHYFCSLWSSSIGVSESIYVYNLYNEIITSTARVSYTLNFEAGVGFSHVSPHPPSSIIKPTVPSVWHWLHMGTTATLSHSPSTKNKHGEATVGWWETCTLRCIKHLVNKGINYQPQLVKDVFHQQDELNFHYEIVTRYTFWTRLVWLVPCMFHELGAWMPYRDFTCVFFGLETTETWENIAKSGNQVAATGGEKIQFQNPRNHSFSD